jgi:hypothetical protein
VHLSHILIDTVSKPVVLFLLDPVPDKSKRVLFTESEDLRRMLMDVFLEDGLLRTACELYVMIASLGDVLDAWSEVYGVLVSDE